MEYFFTWKSLSVQFAFASRGQLWFYIDIFASVKVVFCPISYEGFVVSDLSLKSRTKVLTTNFYRKSKGSKPRPNSSEKILVFSW